MKLAPLYIAALLSLGIICNIAIADGGQVRSVRQQGHYQMTVFTSPTPPRVGLVDISVVLLDLNTGEIVRDSQIKIDVRPSFQSVAAIHAFATEESATNKLLKAAIIELPYDGNWDLTVAATSKEMDAPIEARFEMEVAAQLPAWVSVWPWFTWPAVPIALFWIHRRLVTSRMSKLAIARQLQRGIN